MRACIGILICMLLLTTGCQDSTAKKKTTTHQRDVRLTQVTPGPEAQDQVQFALLRAQRGDVIEFSEGIFDFTQGLSLAVDEVTIVGKGMDKTILTFKNQTSESPGF